MDERPDSDRPDRTDDRRRGLSARGWLLVALAVALAFGLGYGWQYFEATQVRGELTELRGHAELAQLEAELAAATIEAMRGSYEVARQHASGFFTELQESVDEVPPGVRGRARDVLAQRDAVITALSRANPDSGDLLARLFLQLRSAGPAPPEAPAGTTGG